MKDAATEVRFVSKSNNTYSCRCRMADGSLLVANKLSQGDKEELEEGKAKLVAAAVAKVNRHQVPSTAVV